VAIRRETASAVAVVALTLFAAVCPAGTGARGDTVTVTASARTPTLIGIPLQPSKTSPRDAFSSLGSPSDTTWRLGRWSPADSAYHDVASGSLTSIGPGAGYWLVTQQTASIPIGGKAVPLDTFRITLELGPGSRPAWNQLANPFPFPVSVAQLRVQRGSLSVPLGDTANTVTEHAVHTWDAGSGAYVIATVLSPGGGFWIKRIGSGGVKLAVPPTSTTEPQLRDVLKPEGASWAVAVTATQGDRAAQTVVLGVGSTAGDGWSALCASRAPAPPGRFLSLVVPRPNWGENAGDYVRDVRPLGATAEWDLLLSGAEAPGEVRLDVSGLDLPQGSRVVLADPAWGSRREVPAGGSITLAATPDPRALRVRVLAPGETSAEPSGDGLVRILPSPFSRRVAIALSLARGGDVAVDVFDAMGRRVRRLERKASSPGEHVLVWDGADGQGRAQPAGIYLAHWRAGTREGTTRLIKVE
jgi:hypothetical protein